MIFALFGSSILAENSNAATENIPAVGSTASSGIFSRSTPQSLPGSSTLSAASVGYCTLNATNVHFSTYSPNNLGANALVTCIGDSIRISYISVTLYKDGLIEHYLTGFPSAGYASPQTPFEYNIFKTSCISSAASVYWSTAVAHGNYASDGANTSATSTSPRIQLYCGTSF